MVATLVAENAWTWRGRDGYSDGRTEQRRATAATTTTKAAARVKATRVGRGAEKRLVAGVERDPVAFLVRGHINGMRGWDSVKSGR